MALSSYLPARFAMSVAMPKVGVLFVEKMATQTMSWYWSLATLHVHLVRYQLQMFGCNAMTNAAKVIPFKSFRGLANKELVRPQSYILDIESTVALVSQKACPQHAAIRPARIDLRPETFLGRLATLKHGWIARTQKALAMHVAPTPPKRRFGTTFYITRGFHSRSVA